MASKKRFESTLNDAEQEEAPRLSDVYGYSFPPTCVCRVQIMLCPGKAYRDTSGSSHRSRLSPTGPS